MYCYLWLFESILVWLLYFGFNMWFENICRMEELNRSREEMHMHEKGFTRLLLRPFFVLCKCTDLVRTFTTTIK